MLTYMYSSLGATDVRLYKCFQCEYSRTSAAAVMT